MVTPRNISQTPPGMWRYVHPTTGRLFSGAYSIARIMAMVDEYNRSNGLPAIVGLHQKIIEYICEQEPEYCISDKPPTPMQKARNFAQAAAQWVSSGFKHVTQVQFESRKAICESCPYWVNEMTFGYGGCKACGCSGLKLFLPSQRCPKGKWESV